jgi:hypothetical protein
VDGVDRGFHAHINLKQIAIAISGSCVVTLDDGMKRDEVLLNSPSKGLLIEGLTWKEMKNFSKNCVLVLLAIEPYSEEDYVRYYENFLDMANKRRQFRFIRSFSNEGNRY